MWLSLALNVIVESKMTYDIDGRELNLPSVDGAIWQARFDFHHIDVIQITEDAEIFDYCDLNSYTRDNFVPLLLKNGMAENATAFVLYWDVQKFSKCGKVNYMFRGVQHPIFFANQLGKP